MRYVGLRCVSNEACRSPMVLRWDMSVFDGSQIGLRWVSDSNNIFVDSSNLCSRLGLKLDYFTRYISNSKLKVFFKSFFSFFFFFFIFVFILLTIARTIRTVFYRLADLLSYIMSRFSCYFLYLIVFRIKKKKRTFLAYNEICNF